ncbi:MAG TPA: bifunctional nuclease family protein [Thermodesulfobacteriota bacterium]|nr:bifunctional nuclease family protein [Thermodesulfobacteriota bacterium]
MNKYSLFKAIFVFLVLMFSVFTRAEEKGVTVEEEEMTIKGLGFDPQAQTPVVLLSDKENKKVLPIWIGLCEARSIELGLSGEVAPRPLTYDMFAAIVRAMKGKVERIVIVDLRDQVFYAQIEVSLNGSVSKVDARPSDAIALASRMGAPIFVKKSVLERAAPPETEGEKRGT